MANEQFYKLDPSGHYVTPCGKDQLPGDDGLVVHVVLPNDDVHVIIAAGQGNDNDVNHTVSTEGALTIFKGYASAVPARTYGAWVYAEKAPYRTPTRRGLMN